MSNEIDASVDAFFSQYEVEDAVDLSDSSADIEETSEDTKPTQPAEKVEEGKEEGESKEQTPFHEHPRWQEKLKENKALKESKANWDKEKTELMERLEALENKPLTDEDIENMSPKEAMEYARKQAEREYTKKTESSEKEKESALKYIDETLAELKDNGEEFEENKLLKIAEDYTDGDLKKAMNLYKQLNEASNKGATQAEKEAAKRKAAESNTGNKGGTMKTTGFVAGTGWGDLNLK